jgi:FMN phosphatase YigB (HAD superfamily)
MSSPKVDRSRFDAVTFDVDGTLYPLGLQKALLLPYLLRHPLLMGRYSGVVEQVRKEGVVSDDLRGEVARRLGERVGANPDRARQVIDQVVHGAWPATFSPRTAFAGLDEVFAALDASGLPRAVVSDYPPEQKLANMGILGGWAALISCESLGAYKPNPRGLEAAAAAIGVPVGRILHIGDREDTDGEMAAEAGAACLILGRDFRRMEQLAEAFA